jgi:hypothetical protein
MGERDLTLHEARVELESIARKLTVLFGPEATARLLSALLLGVTVGTAGRVAAIEFLEDLAAQLREDHPENWPQNGDEPL